MVSPLEIDLYDIDKILYGAFSLGVRYVFRVRCGGADDETATIH